MAIHQAGIRSHDQEHAVQMGRSPFLPADRDLIQVDRSRRWFLQTGLAGMAGLSLPQILKLQNLSAAEPGPRPTRDKKSVILFWLSGGPSHLDMWDPKPAAPAEIRGPYSTIATKTPGVFLSEHLPLQASISDKLSFLRAVPIPSAASARTPTVRRARQAQPAVRAATSSTTMSGSSSKQPPTACFRSRAAEHLRTTTSLPCTTRAPTSRRMTTTLSPPRSLAATTTARAGLAS